MEYVRTLSKEFDIGSTAELRVENRSSAVYIRGEDTDWARVDVTARLWAETEEEADDQLALIERGIRQEGRRLTIRAPALNAPSLLMIFGRGPRIDYQVTVPRASSGTIVNTSGRIEVDGVAGPLDVESRSGRVALRNIKGNLTITSRSGLVQAEEIGGSVAVESRSGAVRIRACRGGVTVESRSGLTQLEDIEGAINVETRSGAVRYDGPVKAEVKINVSSGSVRLAVDADSVFFLDAESNAGSVRSDLPLRSKSTATPKDAPTVRLRTQAGSIHIGQR